MSYFPIQTLSTYSLLKSPSTPSALIQRAKELGYTTFALTDEDVLYGMVEFYNAARKYDIQPIFGITLKVNGLINQSTLGPLILLAKNNQGYQNLMKISSYKMTLMEPDTANLHDIAKFLTDLIVISPVNGEIDQLLMQGQIDLAVEGIQKLLTLIEPKSLYLGVSITQPETQRQALKLTSERTGVVLIADEQVTYLEPNDYFATRVLKAIDANAVIANLGQASGEFGNQYLKDPTTIKKLYADVGLSTAFANNEQLAKLIDVKLEFKQPQLPVFPLPENETTQGYLQQLALAGLEKRGISTTTYITRLQHELKIIAELGFDDYFLIVWDVVNWAYQQGIQIGPGRGSAAGSLVAYALMITDVDPLEYDLLFERFLNPDRAQMPDIDLDLPDNRREEVLNYVHEKYGHEHVAQIITFGHLAAKQVIRDTGRVFGYTQPQLNQLAKAMPNGISYTLADVLVRTPQFQNILRDLPNGMLLLAIAQKLEGLPRNYSTHAAGIVISREPLTDIIPVQNGTEGRLMTQLSKNPVEALGLLKMDFLGLRNLSILASIVSAVQQKEPAFNLEQIDFEDQATLKLFQDAKTNGIFQFESNGIRAILRELQPDSFEMVVAVNALYRPGPMVNIPHFIARKHGEEPVAYPDPVLKPILASTFGIIVYQEQVMRVASTLAGFSLAEADMLRRAISKKDAHKIDILRQKFIEGAMERQHTQVVATTVYDYIEAFANYGFNRSHSVAYSKMAFQLAFLKVHYPQEFFIVLINSALGNDVKLRNYIQELRQVGSVVVGPDVNRSQRDFSLVDGAIRFGLSAIKGLRSDFITELLAIRAANGPFESLANLIGRLSDKWRKADILTLLIKAGACDNLGYNRHELLLALDGILAAVGLSGASMSLFATMAPKITRVNDFSLTDKLAMEADLLGVYVSAHPVEQYRAIGNQIPVTPINQLLIDQVANVVILITNVRVIRTKKGQEMAFLTGTDASGEISVTIFPQLFKRIKASLIRQKILLVKGKVEQGRELQIVADNIIEAKTFKVKNNANISENPRGQWFLRVPADVNLVEFEPKLRQIIGKNIGENPVILVYEADNRKILLPKDWWLQKNNTLMQSLTTLLGRENVIFKEN